jgi:TatD DNase family protein
MRELALHAQRHAALAERLGVLHCFTGGQKFAGQLLELGYFLSFSGIVTFRNAGALRAVARTVPDARLLIETDTPYLAPVPVRGQRNEPAFLPYVAAALAEARGGSAERIAAVTAENAARVFGGMGAVHTTKDTKST